MTETVQSIKQPRATTGGWYEFATRHRASIAAAVVLVFPLLMPFTALAVNILIYGLYALGFNLVFGYLGLLSFGHAALFGTGAYLCGIAIVHLGWPWYAAIAAGVAGGLLMALVYLGGEAAQVSLQLPAAITGLFQGMLLLFLLGADAFVDNRLRRRVAVPA